MPEDVIGDGVLPFLIGWLLKWASIADNNWNDEYLEGEFLASDTNRGYDYAIDFTLHNRDVSEGLVERALTIFFKRTD